MRVWGIATVVTGMAKDPPLYYAVLAVPVRLDRRGARRCRLLSARVGCGFSCDSVHGGGAGRSVGVDWCRGRGDTNGSVLRGHREPERPRDRSSRSHSGRACSCSAKVDEADELARSRDRDQLRRLRQHPQHLAALRWHRARDRARHRRSRAAERSHWVRGFPLWLAVGSLSVLTAIGWDLWRGQFEPVQGGGHEFTVGDGVTRWWRLLEEGAGWYGLFEVKVWAAILIWLAVVTVLIGIAAWTSRRTDCWVLGAPRDRRVRATDRGSHSPMCCCSTTCGLHGSDSPWTVGVPIVAGMVSLCSGTSCWCALAAAIGVGWLAGFATVARRVRGGGALEVVYFVDARWTGHVPRRGCCSQLRAILAVTYWIWLVTESDAPTGAVQGAQPSRRPGLNAKCGDDAT